MLSTVGRTFENMGIVMTGARDIYPFVLPRIFWNETLLPVSSRGRVHEILRSVEIGSSELPSPHNWSTVTDVHELLTCDDRRCPSSRG